MKLRLTCLIGIFFGVSSWAAGPGNVLVIVNDNSPESKEIGAYYVKKRVIPAKNVCHIKIRNDDWMDIKEFPGMIAKPIKDHLKKNRLADTIDYIVMTKGVPFRINGGRSVDDLLVGLDKPLQVEASQVGTPNPYFRKDEHFSHKKFGIYLVTRLDGYTVSDAKALVDRSLAAKPVKGTFLIDSTPQRNEGGYGAMSLAMSQARDEITLKGYVCFFDSDYGFIGDLKNVMGYFSWGSNDAKYTRKKYMSNQFRPGAIAETAVSTSARTLKRVNDGGQSLITDLVEAGVTGVKGYTAEPTLAAIADPRILFSRYLSGYNLAETYYMASRWICFRDLILGDPLCAPYK